jgi:putative oxidoreductase
VFGLWGGPGIAAFANHLTAFGYQQANTLSWVAGITELVAGAFIVLGLLTPLAAAAVLSIMINAVLLKLTNGFFVTGPSGSDAVEYTLVLGLSSACRVFTGPGRIALDNGRRGAAARLVGVLRDRRHVAVPCHPAPALGGIDARAGVQPRIAEIRRR